MNSTTTAPDHGPEDALDQVWAALRDHYPLMEYLGAYDDEWREEIRPRVRAARDLAEALPVIEELVLRFQDCHTRLLWPGKPERTRPGVRLGWVEGGVAVLRADADTGLAPGDRVLAVDGAEATAAVREAWPRSQGADPEAHAQSACDRLASGRPGTVLHLRTERGDVALTRPPEAPPGRPRTPLGFRRLPEGDAGILRVAAWGGEGFLERMDALFEEAEALPHLVIDVRGNGGGDDALARACAGRFVQRRFLCSIALHREPGTDTYRRELSFCEPRGPWRYTGRVAVLADAGCHSACVHFVAAMAASGAACIVGTPTDGGGGFMRRIDLTCGATVIVSRMFPIDGGVAGIPSPLHGTPPHIPVPPTIADLRAGRDGPLEAALAWLRSGHPIPAAVRAAGAGLPPG